MNPHSHFSRYIYDLQLQTAPLRGAQGKLNGADQRPVIGCAPPVGVVASPCAAGVPSFGGISPCGCVYAALAQSGYAG